MIATYGTRNLEHIINNYSIWSQLMEHDRYLRMIINTQSTRSQLAAYTCKLRNMITANGTWSPVMEHDCNLRFLIATYETQSKLAAHNNNLQQMIANYGTWSKLWHKISIYGTWSQIMAHDDHLRYMIATYGRCAKLITHDLFLLNTIVTYGIYMITSNVKRSQLTLAQLRKHERNTWNMIYLTEQARNLQSTIEAYST